MRSIPAGRGSGLKTFEEISLENETLKATVDKQAKRLSMWETNSQSSYNALAQSFRARKMPSDPGALAQALAMGANAIPPPLLSPQAPSATPDAELAKRLAELEAQVAERNARLDELAKDNEKLEKENKKNSEVLGRYRDQWEKLKAGARKRDMEKRAARIKAGSETTKEGEKAEDEDEAVETEEPGFGKA